MQHAHGLKHTALGKLSAASAVSDSLMSTKKKSASYIVAQVKHVISVTEAPDDLGDGISGMRCKSCMRCAV